MSLNTAVNGLYWWVWAKLPNLAAAADDERGVTVLEWIGMAAVMILFLVLIYRVVGEKGECIGQSIVYTVLDFVAKAWGGTTTAPSASCS